MSSNEFIIRINKDSQGNKLSLENITIEAADALKIFIESLSDFAKKYSDNSGVTLSLKTGSIESVLSYPKSVLQLTTDIEEITANTSNDSDQARLLRNIQEKIQANGLDYNVYHKVNDVKTDLTNIFKNQRIIVKRGPRQEIITEIAFIKGKLFEAGGKKNSNVHILNSKGERKVECSEEDAKKLIRRLYDEIYLVVLKKRKRTTGFESYTYIDSYSSIEKFKEYKNFYKDFISAKALEKYDILHDKIKSTIISDEISNTELIKIFKIFDNEVSDRGTLRTILMSVKPIIKDTQPLNIYYTSMADRLRLGSKNNKI